MPDGSRHIDGTAVPGPQTVVVPLPVEVDMSNNGRVQAALASALASRPEVVVADGTRTGYLDSAAITTLIRAHHQAATAGAQLRVVITSTPVRRVLKLIGADHILLVYPSLGNAYADGSTGSRPPSTAGSEQHEST